MIYRMYILKKLFAALKDGHTITSACKLASISRATFFRWYSQKPDFRARVEKLMHNRNKLVRDALYAKALKGSESACKFWLMNRDKTEDWSNSGESSVVNNVSASAEVHQEVANDPDRAKSRLQDNLSLLERYGHITLRPSEN